MCGIAAVINGSLSEVVRMGNALRHRGTKSNITEVGDLKVWFSHLAITDSNAQPQPYTSGRWTVWLNGYISNYLELSYFLKAPMKTNCDTEFLAWYINYIGGPFNSAMRDLNGFFSILVYDQYTGRTFALTDRYGIKQLYTYTRGDTKYIASEVKSILAVNDVEISERGADDWIYSLGVMNDDTIYSGIDRVKAMPFFKPKTISISYDDAKNRLSMLFDKSISRNKAITVKDGIFLSGGIDSGIIANRVKPEYTFSMDYQDEQFSEIHNIKKNSVGIHHTLVCNQELFNKYKDKAAAVIDDLKAGSCYTNFALTELASKFCTVLYSGAGGDEVFDGYTHRYSKPINDVIRRTMITDDFENNVYYDPAKVTHKDYDWKFLKAVLVVEDRIAGFHTMETRYPLLDNDFVDFALSLPAEYRENKRILKDISGLHKDVVDGRKRGFSNPYITNFQWAMLALKHKIKP
jgi:asparagine synthase (glutamine-hydrolysing)